MYITRHNFGNDTERTGQFVGGSNRVHYRMFLLCCKPGLHDFRVPGEIKVNIKKYLTEGIKNPRTRYYD
jgi:hypothetical protein